MKKKQKRKAKITLIQQALWVMSSPEFLVTDSPLWAAKQISSPYPPEEVANQIVDLQFHGF